MKSLIKSIQSKHFITSSQKVFRSMSTTAETHHMLIENQVVTDHDELKSYYQNYKSSGEMKWFN